MLYICNSKKKLSYFNFLKRGLIGLNITGFPSTLFKSAVKVRDIDLSKNQLDGLHVPCDAFSANTLLRSMYALFSAFFLIT
jgi:hypothetical protein